ncbi:MAG: hypothetical protein GY838_17440 [bacterium]|nr:hypothetical protein [bacterium]
MSGNVVVTMADGDVLVRGDRADNAVIADQDGLPAGQIRIRGADGTTINGQAEVILDDVLGAVTMRLRGGDDTVTLDGVTLPGDLTVLGGRGDNAVVLTDVDIGGDVTVRNGRGADTFELTGASRIGDDLTIDNRSGGATTTITGVSDGGAPPAITPLEIGGDVSLRNRRGATTTTLEHVTVGGDMAARNARGVDVLELLGQTKIGDDLRVRHGAGGSTTRLEGDEANRVEVEDFTLRGGGGRDDILFGYVTVGSDFDVDVRGGGDFVDIKTTDVNGHTNVAMGGGSDVVAVERDVLWVDGEWVGTASQFGQRTFLDMGRGRDDIRLGIAVGEWPEVRSVVVFSGHAAFVGGSGQDELVFGAISTPGPTAVHEGFEVVRSVHIA